MKANVRSRGLKRASPIWRPASLAVGGGVHEPSDGTVAEAATAHVDEDCTPVSFLHSFGDAPMVFARPKTENGGKPVVVRRRTGTADGLLVARLPRGRADGRRRRHQQPRYRGLTSTGVEAVLEQQQSAGSETDYADEAVADATFEDGTTLLGQCPGDRRLPCRTGDRGERG